MLTPVFGANSGGMTLQQAIVAAGLTSNLQLSLDAGDGASYTSGTKWLDRSGNGYDFFLGSDGTGAADPTFTGSPGTLSSYWALDGTQYLTYDTTNETWMQNLHKNNAAFTFLCAFYRGGVTGSIVGTNGGTANTGMSFSLVSNALTLLVSNAGALALNASSGGATLVANRWHVLGVSVDEAAGTGFMYYNGTADNIVTTYSSPAAGNASFTMQASAIGNALNPVSSGSRSGFLAAWSAPLTEANLDAIFDRVRGRYGI